MKARGVAKIIIVSMVSFLFTFKDLVAQQDYAVTDMGDTIRGHITSNLITGKVKLKTNDSVIHISSGKYSYYWIRRHKLLYSKITTERSAVLWARVIERGKISLYSRVQKRSHNQREITWFINKNEGEVSTLKRAGIGGNIGRRGEADVIKELLADNPSVVQEYEQHPQYTFRNLRRLIRTYNSTE